MNNYPMPELKYISAKKDSRGMFMETFRESDYKEHFVQINSSGSYKNVIRGLHFQVAPFDQAKIIRVLRGRIFDVVVDLRRNSPGFGRWMSYYLGESEPKSLYIPSGYAHGFCSTDGYSEIMYFCSNYYSKEHERTLYWADPQLKIPWPTSDPILSDKDNSGKLFIDCDYFED